MANTMVAAGLTIAAAGFAGYYVLQTWSLKSNKFFNVYQNLPSVVAYRSGLEPKMTKQEAALILGILWGA